MQCPVTKDFNEYDREQTRLEREHEQIDYICENLDLLKAMLQEQLVPWRMREIKILLSDINDDIKEVCAE